VEKLDMRQAGRRMKKRQSIGGVCCIVQNFLKVGHDDSRQKGIFLAVNISDL
jgi:hypothetical protein